MREEVFVGLGSNLGKAQENVALAAEAVADLPGCESLRLSSFYETAPQDYPDQPWFINAVLMLSVEDSEPPVFLARLLELEQRLGRVREGVPRFGPRRIDLDLLLFGNRVLTTPFCTLPHPRMLKRAFVLCPLAEIAPEYLILGKTAAEYLAQLTWHREGLRIFQP
ncbi:MAG: 2-amino-4-hydroxy-6-hydroxymethyldihydropteridine diphosphokinase [Desulfovibrio sp.]|nr:2-amino-4-hydroxy-6-hydroxymethyldihydropteridine diphosphokinase [Desulfovibrio sp.]